MKLSAEDVAAIERQTEATPVPDDHPASAALSEHFGEHTFYLDQAGLFVFEPIEAGDAGERPVVIIQVAAWADEEMNGLAPMDPRPGTLIVDLADTAVPGPVPGMGGDDVA